jgi:hypothetical protein
VFTNATFCVHNGVFHSWGTDEALRPSCTAFRFRICCDGDPRCLGRPILNNATQTTRIGRPDFVASPPCVRSYLHAADAQDARDDSIFLSEYYTPATGNNLDALRWICIQLCLKILCLVMGRGDYK